MESNGKHLHPFVYWAQTQTQLMLRVNLQQIYDIKVNASEKGSLLQFSANGVGAYGRSDYNFRLNLYKQVEETQINVQSMDRYVLLSIKKVEHSKWSRLTKDPQKLPWLRVDFERYVGSDSDSGADNCQDEEIEQMRPSKHFELLQKKIHQSEAKPNKLTPNKSRLEKHPTNNNDVNIFNPFNRSLQLNKSKNMKHDYRREAVTKNNSGRKNMVRNPSDIKTIYLFIYNLMMFVSFSFVVSVLSIKLMTKTLDNDSIRGSTNIVNILTWVQLLETVHPVLGLVPGGAFMPFIQVVGRLLVNFFLSDDSIRQDAYPFPHLLMLVWSSIEIFRYSFYALRVFNVDVYPIKWCRYSLFVPLYPLGGLSESMCLLSACNVYGKTGKYTYFLPNPLNISFHLPTALRIYVFLLPPTILYLMSHMFNQRAKQLKLKEKVA